MKCAHAQLVAATILVVQRHFHYSITPPLSSTHFQIRRREGLECRNQIHDEARRGAAVDESVIVGNRDWHHLSLLNLFILHDRLERAPADAEDRGLWLVHDGREVGPANAALIRDGETAPAPP